MSADEVVAFVQDWYREMHPVYHLGPVGPAARGLFDEAPTGAAEASGGSRVGRQAAVVERFWRRDDTWAEGDVQSDDGAYDLSTTSAWEALPTASRVWQVSHVRDRHPCPFVHGYLVGVFDDGLRLIDELVCEIAPGG